MPAITPTKVVTHVLAPCRRFPNSACNKLPLLIMKHGFQPSGSPTEIEEILTDNGWIPAWRYEMFPFSHFHSNVHEALGVFKGSALLQFGGDADQAVQESVEAGDVILIPAGVAHKQVQAYDAFSMVGAYPAGAPQWDCLQGKGGKTERQQAEHRINLVKLPEKDPLLGDRPDSPMRTHWQNH